MIEIVLSGKDLSGPAFASADKKAGDLEKRMMSISKVAIGVGAATATGLLAVTAQAGNLESVVADALTLVDAQGDEYTQLKNTMTSKAVEMSRELAISADDIGRSYYQVLSAGADVTSDSFDKLTRTALIMAELTGLETAAGVEILSDTINAFGLEMSEAAKVADTFFTASKLTATTVPQLAGAMREAGPAAAVLSQDLATVATLLDAFAAKGVKGVKAGTALRIIFTRLSAGSEEVNDAMKKLGASMFDEDENARDLIVVLREMQEGYLKLSDEQKANTLKVIAGEEAFSKLAGILEGDLDLLDSWREQIREGGDLQATYNTRLQAFDKRLAALKVELKAVAVEMGQTLLPLVETLITDTAENVRTIGTWIQANEDIVPTIAAISFALIGTGGLLIAIRQVTKAMRIMKVVMAGTFGPVVLGLTAITGGLIEVDKWAKRTGRSFDELNETSLGIEIDDEQAKKLRDYQETLANTQRIINRFGGETEVGAEILGGGFTTAANKARLLQIEINKIMFGVEGTGEASDQFLTRFTNKAGDATNKTVDLVDALSDIDAKGARFNAIFPDIDQLTNLALASQTLREIFLTEKERADLSGDAVFDPGIKNVTVFDVEEIRKATAKVEQIVSSAFMRMTQGGKVFKNALTVIWQSLAQIVINEISRMIAKWLVLQAIKTFMSFIPLQEGGTVTKAQHGGTISRGTRGVDNQVFALGRDETVLSHELTDAMREQLLGGGAVGEQGERIGITINAGVVTTSDQEAVRFARLSEKEVSNFTRRYVAKGVSVR